MSGSLIKRPQGSVVDGLIPAAASWFIPGLGQLINRQSDKAIGVFAVSVIAGASFLASIPLLGKLAGAVAAVTWLYGIVDGYLTGRRKRE